jgi:hypothetical protein
MARYVCQRYRRVNYGCLRNAKPIKLRAGGRARRSNGFVRNRERPRLVMVYALREHPELKTNAAVVLSFRPWLPPNSRDTSQGIQSRAFAAGSP